MNEVKQLPQSLRIGIAGAGAVGCHYGLALQRAGLEVVFLARGEHVKAIQKHGLRYESAGVTECMKVNATDDMDALSDCDVIVLSSKTTQLTEMLSALKGVVRPDVIWLTMQNGVQAADKVLEIVPHAKVIAASAYIGVRIEQPGYVIHSAAGHVCLGGWGVVGSGDGYVDDVVQELCSAWQSSGVDAQKVDDVGAVLWQKMLWNCGFNAMTALSRRFAKDVAMNPDTTRWVRATMQEAREVAQALGITLDEDVIAKHLELTLQTGSVKTSMWQDLEHHRATEIAAMNGYIVEQGLAHGIETPVNSLLTDMIKLAEGG